MLSRKILWDSINRLLVRLRDEGKCDVALYDIEMPAPNRGTLRVFVTSEQGITFDDCAAVSRGFDSDEELSEILLDFSLEVSSPGVNRKLSRVEHYQSAVGERIRVVIRGTGTKSSVSVGKLLDVGSEKFSVELEKQNTRAKRRAAERGIPEEVVQEISFADVKEAHVDFLF